MKEYKHLMLDLETMGNKSYSAIVSIGAVEFDLLTGETGEEFYTTVSLQSCVDLGLELNVDTVLWWMKQNEEARKELTTKASTETGILGALGQFAVFCKDKGYEIWGNSARFDLGLLQNAYNKANLPIPWDFRKERDVRTLVALAPKVKDEYKQSGVLHNAIADCYNQIGYCTAIWQSLTSNVPSI